MREMVNCVGHRNENHCSEEQSIYRKLTSEFSMYIYILILSFLQIMNQLWIYIFKLYDKFYIQILFIYL